ncbi:MAG TPA: PQQ-dependent sugar dehydrogenase [Gemmatimonadaceae bacterium]|jgi:glucose/arabinose dehydrogenase|nr:PQQ-dependent sugar dehydrogenase [Gemmatimonadaceae bacterium]
MRSFGVPALLAASLAIVSTSGLALAACGGGAPPASVAGPGDDTTARVAALDGKLSVPAGFTVGYFAQGLAGVRFMAVGPDGAVYATQPGKGRVVRLADANGDGAADGVVEVVAGLDQPHGLAFHKGALYVANTDGVVRVALGADGRASGSPVYVNRYSGNGGHWTRTIVFGPDSAMYVAVGSTCNLCVEQSSDRAAVLRFDEDGSGKRVFASGLRNAVGLAFEPTTGALWASQNERDNLQPNHEDLPPEEINILTDGGDYGWPYCYGDRVPNPEYGDAARCASTIPPAAKLQAHSAPLGMTFLSRATLLPASYRSDLLVAYHGSWNRDTPTGAKVVRIHVAGGQPGQVEDLVTGWQRADGSRWGRPVDVVVAADGSVLISDDAAGAIYRLTGAAQ